MIDTALESIDNIGGSTILIGDNLETDTIAAQDADLSSILILTGVTNEKTADASDIKPTWRVRNYDELSNLVFSGWYSRVAVASSNMEALIYSVQKQKTYTLMVEVA